MKSSFLRRNDNESFLESANEVYFDPVRAVPSIQLTNHYRTARSSDVFLSTVVLNQWFFTESYINSQIDDESNESSLNSMEYSTESQSGTTETEDNDVDSSTEEYSTNSCTNSSESSDNDGGTDSNTDGSLSDEKERNDSGTTDHDDAEEEDDDDDGFVVNVLDDNNSVNANINNINDINDINDINNMNNTKDKDDQSTKYNEQAPQTLLQAARNGSENSESFKTANSDDTKNENDDGNININDNEDSENDTKDSNVLSNDLALINMVNSTPNSGNGNVANTIANNNSNTNNKDINSSKNVHNKLKIEISNENSNNTITSKDLTPELSSVIMSDDISKKSISDSKSKSKSKSHTNTITTINTNTNTTGNNNGKKAVVPLSKAPLAPSTSNKDERKLQVYAMSASPPHGRYTDDMPFATNTGSNNLRITRSQSVDQRKHKNNSNEKATGGFLFFKSNRTKNVSFREKFNFGKFSVLRLFNSNNPTNNSNNTTHSDTGNKGSKSKNSIDTNDMNKSKKNNKNNKNSKNSQNGSGQVSKNNSNSTKTKNRKNSSKPNRNIMPHDRIHRSKSVHSDYYNGKRTDMQSPLTGYDNESLDYAQWNKHKPKMSMLRSQSYRRPSVPIKPAPRAPIGDHDRDHDRDNSNEFEFEREEKLKKVEIQQSHSHNHNHNHNHNHSQRKLVKRNSYRKSTLVSGWLGNSNSRLRSHTSVGVSGGGNGNSNNSNSNGNNPNDDIESDEIEVKIRIDKTVKGYIFLGVINKDVANKVVKPGFMVGFDMFSYSFHGYTGKIYHNKEQTDYYYDPNRDKQRSKQKQNQNHNHNHNDNDRHHKSRHHHHHHDHHSNNQNSHNSHNKHRSHHSSHDHNDRSHEKQQKHSKHNNAHSINVNTDNYRYESPRAKKNSAIKPSLDIGDSQQMDKSVKSNISNDDDFQFLTLENDNKDSNDILYHGGDDNEVESKTIENDNDNNDDNNENENENENEIESKSNDFGGYGNINDNFQNNLLLGGNSNIDNTLPDSIRKSVENDERRGVVHSNKNYQNYYWAEAFGDANYHQNGHGSGRRRRKKRPRFPVIKTGDIITIQMKFNRNSKKCSVNYIINDCDIGTAWKQIDPPITVGITLVGKGEQISILSCNYQPNKSDKSCVIL